MVLHAMLPPRTETTSMMVTYARTILGEYVLVKVGCFPSAGATRARKSAPPPRQTQKSKASHVVRATIEASRRGIESNARNK